MRLELRSSRVRILPPLTERSSAASPASFSPVAAVCLASVSGFCSYPFSRLCLPLYDSFPFAIYRPAVGGAAAPPIPGLTIFILLKPGRKLHCILILTWLEE